MLNSNTNNDEYQVVQQNYQVSRKQYYNNLMNGKNITENSPEYISHMNSNKQLNDVIQKRINMSDSSYDNEVENEFKTEMIYNTTRLQDERNKMVELLKGSNVLKGNMILSQRYAEMERFRQTIWMVICGLIIVFATKSWLMPSNVTDVFNTILFAIIIFLVVYVTEHMGSASMFLIWLIIVIMIGTYIIKHIADRD